MAPSPPITTRAPAGRPAAWPLALVATPVLWALLLFLGLLDTILRPFLVLFNSLIRVLFGF